MCGIAGLWSLVRSGWNEKENIKNVEFMSDALVHRGPDDEGLWFDAGSGIYLGHRRLSIIDLTEKAHQPMQGKDGGNWIVFNGEIYNYLEIKSQLAAVGIQFKSDSDTEVILVLYEKYGLDFVQHLRGMFAFALWDSASRRLIMARDRVGKKPLYYLHFNDNLYFASEIKALRAVVPESVLEIDERSLDEYLSFGFISGEKTIYRKVRELLPGSLLVASTPNDFKIQRYWQPQWEQRKEISYDEAVDEADKLLKDSVSLRLRADVPLGIFLSGGVDSGLITALAAQLQTKPCVTFSVGFEDDAYDERPLAKKVAERYRTDHHEILIKPDVSSILPKIVRAYDEPFADPSCIPSYYVAQYARRHVKVVLNGDGGDELFGGYRRYTAASFIETMNKSYFGKAAVNLGTGMLRFMPLPQAHRTPYAFLYRFLRGASFPYDERCLSWLTEGFNSVEKNSLYKIVPPVNYAMDEFKRVMGEAGVGDGVGKMMAIDFIWSLPYDLLVKMDIATMSHGLEARSPFLDHHVVEWACRLPLKYKVRGMKTKVILRQLAGKYLPKDVAYAPKRGFEIPLTQWVRHDLREMIHDLCLSENGILFSLFDKSFVRNLLKGNRSMDTERWSKCVWLLFVLAAWEKFS